MMAGPLDYSSPVRRSLTPVRRSLTPVGMPSVGGLAYSAPGYEINNSYVTAAPQVTYVAEAPQVIQTNNSYVTAAPQVTYVAEAPQVIQTSYIAEAPRVQYVAAAPQVYEQHISYQDQEVLRMDELRLLPMDYGYEAMQVSPQIVYEIQAPEPERRVESVRSAKVPPQPEPEPESAPRRFVPLRVATQCVTNRTAH
jgi:hypothetical protein